MAFFTQSRGYHLYNTPQYFFNEWDPFPGGPPLMPTPLVTNSAVEWKETPEGHVLKVQIPVGMKKEGVKVELEEGNIICITGEKSFEREEKGDHFYRVERSSGRFVKRYQLPEKVKAEHMKAHLENGVLTVVVPRKERKMICNSQPIHIF